MNSKTYLNDFINENDEQQPHARKQKVEDNLAFGEGDDFELNNSNNRFNAM